MASKWFWCFLTLLSVSVALSGSQEVCACCKDQVLRQDLTNCSDIITPASGDEVDFLKSFCYTTSYNTRPDYSEYRILLLPEFETGLSSGNFLRLPTTDCSRIYSSLEGLVYMLPLRNSSRYYKELSINKMCFAAVDFIPEGNITSKVPGVACFRTSNTDDYVFVPFNSTKTYSRKNGTTTSLFLIRRPTSYAITSLTDVGSPSKSEVRMVVGYDDSNEEYNGEFTACNPSPDPILFVLFIDTVNYYRLTFRDYDFYPRLTRKLDIYPYSYNDYNILTIKDSTNTTRIMLSKNMDDEIPFARTRRERLSSPEENEIPAWQCITAEVVKTWETWQSSFNATIEFDFGKIGEQKQKQIFRTGMKNSIITELKLVNVRFEPHQGFVILSLNEVIFYSAILIGIVVFLILLCITVKCMSCVEKTDFRKDLRTTREGLRTAGEFIERRAAILGDQLTRMGDYVCNVGTWIYQELK